MSDVFELVLVLNLRDDLSDAEVADLRWHLGLGPRPGTLTILTQFPVVIDDDHGRPRLRDEPRPVLSQRGAAWVVGGALCGELLRRDRSPGWALTVRQEVHPDEFDTVRALLDWLGVHADYDFVDLDGSPRSGGAGNYVGYLRFCEDTHPVPLTITNAVIAWPHEPVDGF